MKDFSLYACEDKGRAQIIVAPDLENAKSMVDANTKLFFVGKLIGSVSSLDIEGELNPKAILLECYRKRLKDLGWLE